MALESSIDLSELKKELGSALRTTVVGDIDSGESEVVYVRSDVEQEYPPEMRDRIFETLVFEYLGSPAKESDFEPLGELEFTVRSFENGNIVMGWNEELLMFVSVEPSAHFVAPTIRILKKQVKEPAKA